MNITKTLYVERQNNPKLARRHINNKQIYEKIMQFLYGDIDGIAIGQSVEDYVKKLFKHQTIKECIGGFPQCFENTKQLIEQRSPIIYQPWFKYIDLMVRCDFLVLNNEENTYDLWEVKAKNSVKKNNDIIKDDLNHDIGFQHYVLKRAMGDRYSGRAFLVYLNKEYKKQGDVIVEELIVREDITDQLFEENGITTTIQTIRRELAYPKDVFDQHHLYNNEDHLTFFGESSVEGSIREIPGINAKKKELFERGKTMISDISPEDKELLANNKGEITRSMNYIDLFQSGQETIINKQAIKEKMDGVTYPLFFYDYETVSTPIPVFDGTISRQHVIVQYSIHKVDIDGTITHHQDIIKPGEASNHRILEKLQHDLEGGNGTYIVRFKGFENKRNEESAELFPELQEFFATVNQHTFDLMEIFSEGLYFDKRFRGSSSIKKVLPVMSDLSYDSLDIGNGALASTILSQLISGKLDVETANQHIKHLQEYCEQDTMAMVKIWEKLKMEIE